MWIRMLPGLAISAVLAVLFCLDDNKPEKRPSSSSALVFREAAPSASPAAPTPANGFFRQPAPVAAAQPRSLPQVNAVPPRAETPGSAAMAEKTTSGRREPTPAAMRSAAFAATEKPRGEPREEPPFAATEEFVPARRIRLAGRIGSTSALANPSLPEARCDAAESPFPAGAPPPMAIAASAADLPPRGVYAWIATERSGENQRLRGDAFSQYDHDTATYGVGMRYDWSMDTVVGVSADLVDNRVKSRQAYDTRKNDITGYRLAIHCDSLLLEKYLIGVSGFFGRSTTKGSGRVGGPTAGGAVMLAWREDDHDSDSYGFSGRFGLPLLWGNDIKILNEIGLDYRKLRGRAYTAELDGVRTISMPAVHSASLSIPLATTVKRDFMTCWGLITPRVSTGVAFELDDTATGVRALQASAASRFDYDPLTGFHSAGVRYDASQKVFFQLGAGIEIKTIGGWEFSAEYERTLAEKYSRDRFRLELGRCF